jgi:hypothetical protein
MRVEEGKDEEKDEIDLSAINGRIGLSLRSKRSSNRGEEEVEEG